MKALSSTDLSLFFLIFNFFIFFFLTELEDVWVTA